MAKTKRESAGWVVLLDGEPLRWDGLRFILASEAKPWLPSIPVVIPVEVPE